MPDMEKVIKGLKIHADGCGYRSHHCDAMECPYRYGDESCDIEEMCRDAFELLKEQEAMNVDTFVQWCIDSHIMGDATVSGIKYWVGKYKETNESR